MQTKESSNEEQAQRAPTVFTGIYFKVIMLEISPTEPDRDDVRIRHGKYSEECSLLQVNVSLMTVAWF